MKPDRHAERIQLEQAVHDARAKFRELEARKGEVTPGRLNRAGKELADAKLALARHVREFGQ